MQQSNFIFGMILIAFIVFITVRGELPTYLSLLRGSGNSTTANNVSDTPVEKTGNVLDSAEMSLENAGKILDLFGG